MKPEDDHASVFRDSRPKRNMLLILIGLFGVTVTGMAIIAIFKDLYSSSRKPPAPNLADNPRSSAAPQSPRTENELPYGSAEQAREIQTRGQAILGMLDNVDIEIQGWYADFVPLLTNDRGRGLAGRREYVHTLRTIFAEQRPTKADTERLRADVSELMSQPTQAPGGDPAASIRQRFAAIKQKQADADAMLASFRTVRRNIEAMLAAPGQPGSLSLAEAMAAADVEKTEQSSAAKSEQQAFEERQAAAIVPFEGQWVSRRWRFALRFAGLDGIATQSNCDHFSRGSKILRVKSIDRSTFTGRLIFTDGKWYDISGDLSDHNHLRIRGNGLDWLMERVAGEPEQIQARLEQEHLDRMKTFFAEPENIEKFMPHLLVSSKGNYIAAEMGQPYADERYFMAWWSYRIAKSDPKKYGQPTWDFDEWRETWKFTPAGEEVHTCYEQMMLDSRFQATPFDAFRYAIESRSLREREFRSLEWLNDKIARAKHDKLDKAKIGELERWRDGVTRGNLKAPPDPTRP